MNLSEVVGATTEDHADGPSPSAQDTPATKPHHSKGTHTETLGLGRSPRWAADSVRGSCRKTGRRQDLSARWGMIPPVTCGDERCEPGDVRDGGVEAPTRIPNSRTLAADAVPAPRTPMATAMMAVTRKRHHPRLLEPDVGSLSTLPSVGHDRVIRDCWIPARNGLSPIR